MFESFQSGRYKVTDRLGEGGKGIVFKAEDTRLRRTVAVKVIKGEGLDQQSFARFEREAQATAGLSHPHIVTVYDIGQEGESHYLVLELVDGPSLRGLISSQPGGRCDLATTLRIGSQVCQALEYAHSHGILHRDIKPENIMITAEGVAKLMDFGLARALGGPQLTQRGVIVGTAAYLPPEQALGKGSDARSDLYSLGCVLYEMVTGRPTFPGDDPVKVIFSHVNDPPVMPRRIAAEIPETLEQVILKLLSKDPDKRYQSAGELVEALKSIEVAEAAPAEAEAAEAVGRIPTPEPRWAQPLVGREEEMRTLRARLDAALGGEGSLIFLTGEAGIGKTRLAHELRSYARLRGTQFVTGRGYEREGATPYRPWVDIISEYLRWAPPMLLFKVVGIFALELAKLVPELAEKLGTIPPSEQVPPAQQRLRLFQAVTGFFTNISKEGPLVLFLDDLQWADEDSLELLHHVAQNTASERIMAVGAYRDLELEDRRSLSRLVAEMNRERLFHPLPLKRLGSHHVSQMVRQTFGEEVSPELGELVYGRTEGNPFFVEEVLRSLLEEGALSPGERGWEVKDLSQIHIPRGIKALVQDRLEHLDEECRQVLAIAAVIGREFSFAVLREVSGIEEDRLVDLIDRCLQARLVVERRIPGEELYAFADTQVRDVLYEGISPIRRRGAIEADKRNGMMLHLRRDYASYAELLKRKGDLSRARENLNTATRIYRECGADGWVKKAEELLPKI